jgi:hypothetical protein
MDELTMGKFGTEQKSIVGWDATHTKMSEQTGLKLRKRTIKKLRATSNVFNVECCGSSLLTSNKKK